MQAEEPSNRLKLNPQAYNLPQYLTVAKLLQKLDYFTGKMLLTIVLCFCRRWEISLCLLYGLFSGPYSQFYLPLCMLSYSTDTKAKDDGSHGWWKEHLRRSSEGF